MSKKLFWDRVIPTSGQKASNYEGSTYEFKYNLPSYASIDLTNSFFLITDTIQFNPNLSNNDDTNLFIDSSVDILKSNVVVNSNFNPITREQNHFWNGLSDWKVLLNGQLQEQQNSYLPQLDFIKKRLMYGNSNQTLKNYQNVFNDYRERYNIYGNVSGGKLRANTIETVAFPDFSGLFTMEKNLGGGQQFAVELTFASDYWLKMLNQSWGQAPYTWAGSTTIGDQLLQVSSSDLKNAYSIKSVELYLNVKHNEFIPPIDTPLVYDYEKWSIFNQSLNTDVEQNFNFNIPRNCRGFGFCLQNTACGKFANSGTEIWNFSGKPRNITRGKASAVGWSQVERESEGCQYLKNYRLEYGKILQPYSAFDSRLTTDNDFRARPIYERLLESNKDKYSAGEFSKHEEFNKYGQIWWHEFRHIDPSDQDVLRLQLFFNSAPSNLSLVYFYYQNSQLTTVYDYAQQVVQVVNSAI